MTTSETKFQKLLKTRYSGALIVKYPDYKQGAMRSSGFPDYLVIFNGEHLWFEVKMSHSNSSFRFNLFEDSQWIGFKHMLDVGVDVNIAIYDNKWRLCMFKFSELYSLQRSGINSVPL